MPTVCLATCCLLEPPPEFPHTAPPKPPSVRSYLSCPAIIKQWPEHSTRGGDVQVHISAGNDIKYNTDSYNHTRISPLPPDNGASTASNPSVTDNNKSVSVGMVLGIIFGLLVLLVLIFLVWICTRSKPVKCETAKQTDEGSNISFLHKCRLDASSWKRPAVPAKMLRHLFKNSDKCDGVNSTASSESGYCEDIVDNQESTSPKTPVTLRNRQPRPSNSQLLSVTDTTPDIIASAQINLEDLPKRWSMFGLLPSLKPVLLAPVNQSEMPDMDKPINEGNKLLHSGRINGTGDQTIRKSSNDVIMKSLNADCLKAPSSQRERNTRHQAKPKLVDGIMDAPSNKPVLPKTSRIRIRSDGNQPEVEV